jgi:hypothetical protein
MLYPSDDPEAQAERIVGRPPTGGGLNTIIILRPIYLPTLAEIVSSAGAVSRQEIARDMLWGDMPPNAR